MTKRPLSVTVVACMFIAAGVVGLAYHATEFTTDGRFQYDVVWVCIVRLLAIVFGVFMLRGNNWARWGLLVWMAYHVVLSAFHTPTELIVHGLLLAVIAYFLVRPEASNYFLRVRVQTAPTPE